MTSQFALNNKDEGLDLNQRQDRCRSSPLLIFDITKIQLVSPFPSFTEKICSLFLGSIPMECNVHSKHSEVDK
jgi:hypothetical protein